MAVNHKLGHSAVYVSNVTALAAGAATINITALSHAYRHWFAAIEYYDDVAGGSGDVVTPTAGTETYTVTTPVRPNEQSPITNSPLNSADKEVADWAAPTDKVRCVLASVSGNGATHVRLRVWGATS